jgi:hypothetical protein
MPAARRTHTRLDHLAGGTGLARHGEAEPEDEIRVARITAVVIGTVAVISGPITAVGLIVFSPVISGASSSLITDGHVQVRALTGVGAERGGRA